MNLLLNKGRRNVQASSFTKAYSIRVGKSLGVERDRQLFGGDGDIEDSLDRLGTNGTNILRVCRAALISLRQKRSRTNNASHRCQACDSCYRAFQN